MFCNLSLKIDILVSVENIPLIHQGTPDGFILEKQLTLGQSRKLFNHLILNVSFCLNIKEML